MQKDIYKITLDKKIFDNVLKGKSKFDVELNDRSRQSYKEGNVITFVSSDAEQTDVVRAKITKMLYFETLKELIDMVGKKECGFSSSVTVDTIEDNLNFKPEDVEKYGLVAIEFEVEQ